MLASRPISRNGENANANQRMMIAKTPGRGLKNENALRNLPGTVGRGKANVLQTPFQAKGTKTGPKDIQTGPSKLQLQTISRPFLDKTPFPNRIISLQNQTPLNRDPSESPDSAQRPSSTRKHIRLPRHSQKFETPLNTKPHWDISEDEIDIAVPAEVPKVVEEKEDYDEVEYMAPNTLDLPYQPPFDFDLPDYKEVGRSILEFSRKGLVEEPQIPPDVVPDINNIGLVSWDMIPLPELEDDNPFRIARAELQKEKQAAKKPITRPTTKPVPVPAITRTRSIPATTRTSRPGTSTSTAPSSTHARTAPNTTTVSRPRAQSAATVKPKSTASVTRPVQRKPVATAATTVKPSATTSRVTKPKSTVASSSTKRPATSASHHKPTTSTRTRPAMSTGRHTALQAAVRRPAQVTKEKMEEDDGLILKVDVVKDEEDDFLFDV
ncbi:hypothetical protein Moror_4226 [Moniliophthora roreri MCA 2997]|uniref:Uncharacterized protein n=2 Tax=Moniliophthora roreri TaxID=221103 RepID=V2XDK4_MONRO|nr:hypothetical protein Moror_4226 [Moniliophthora roreri MCA 2997]KAI3602795.1 hypothetical protein WG66_008106 [Moniliophthora roreri]